MTDTDRDAPGANAEWVAGARGDGARAWHALEAGRVASLLGSDLERGITPTEAQRRRGRVGPNRVSEARPTPLWRLALDQFRSLVVLLLLAAAVLAALVGETTESLAILAVLILNAAIGFGTEWRARRSLERLRALTVPQALVRRDGGVQRVAAETLVPGDLVVLEAGSQVPADARLARSTALRVNEAALTGESAPVEKDAAVRLDPATPLAERATMVYLGTVVLAGSGLAVVTATGIATELGRIGQLVALAGERATPLERQVEGLARQLVGLALAVCAVVAVAGVLHGQPLGLMVETAITLAIAAIPEGLPAVVAVALAAGLWRLARAGALVRRLPAVEALGSTTVICADKTGTMTENRMTVARVVLDGRRIAVDGPMVFPADPDLLRLFTVAALASDASLERRGDEVIGHGDPTETALLVTALKVGLDPALLTRQWPRRHELPFASETRLMATFNEAPDGGRVLLVKGAPAAVLERSRLTEAERSRLLESNRALAGDGFRVLAVAWRPEGWPDGWRVEDLTFLGFVGLEDPVRPGVREAIAHCRAAGIRTIMLTGDQRSTAEAVGRQLGLEPAVIRSRVSPEDKLELVRALQVEGEVVAMTGDGVNDAPALVRADVGVAMGRHGTDVAREAADIVLTDDDFTTIVRAVGEGRVIHANLRKVIRFLFSCNLSEILTIFVAVVAGLPSPLLPLQILWINLVTDILPAMALIRDPAEPDVMQRPPRDPREGLVPRPLGARMLVEGALLAAGVLSGYAWMVAREGAGPPASTVAFLAVVLIQPLQALHCRSEHAAWWRLPANPLVGISLAVLVAVQWGAITWPPLARLLGTVPLGLEGWLVAAVAVLWPVALLEGVKAWRGRR